LQLEPCDGAIHLRIIRRANNRSRYHFIWCEFLSVPLSCSIGLHGRRQQYHRAVRERHCFVSCGQTRCRQSERASGLAILPNTTHVTLMQRIDVIAPMINDFLNAKPTPAAPATRRD
jgi:hypothetical protein